MIDKMITTAKEVILENKASKGFELTQLWKEVIKKLKLSKDDAENLVSDFYIELIENPDFIKLENKKWSLRQLISFDEFDAISKSLFSDEGNVIIEEDYKNFISAQEANEMKHGFRNSDTAALDIEEDNKDDDLSKDTSDDDLEMDIVDEEASYE